MSNLNFEKQQLRTEFKSKRSLITKKEIDFFSEEISENFITNLLPQIYHQNSKSIFSLYIQANNEVDTTIIKKHFINNNIKFSYPKIKDKNLPLEFILHEESQTLVKNQDFPKLLEAKNGINVIPNILILPLLAFDSSLSRLGMGGGFFDRTINSIKKQNDKVIIIGLAYDFQRFYKLLPIEKTDQKLDFVVTQKKIFSSN